MLTAPKSSANPLVNALVFFLLSARLADAPCAKVTRSESSALTTDLSVGAAGRGALSASIMNGSFSSFAISMSVWPL